MKETLNLSGMHCASCATTIERAVRSLEGVNKAEVNFALQKISLEYDENKVKSFNLFRHSLHATTIITYDELLKRLEVVYG